MLHACLTRLALAADRNVAVMLSVDRGGSAECEQIAEGFSSSFGGLYLRRTPEHPWRGNSRNVISGLKDCLRLDRDLVHVVEDDVMVALGYFRFHEAMHTAAPDAFAVSACRNQNLEGKTSPAAAYRHHSYQSLGVSMRPETAARIVEHDRAAYYGNMVGYCRATFPASVIPPGNAEQDGLVNRIRESLGGVTVYADKPRAFHAGFHGYNRKGRELTGSVEERSARILSMTSEEMNRMAESIRDHEVIDLDEVLPTAPEEEALSWAT